MRSVFSNSAKDFRTGYSNYFKEIHFDSSGDNIQIRCKKFWLILKLMKEQLEKKSVFKLKRYIFYIFKPFCFLRLWLQIIKGVMQLLTSVIRAKSNQRAGQNIIYSPLNFNQLVKTSFTAYCTLNYKKKKKKIHNKIYLKTY